MPEFNVTGEIDPFLHVSMRQGEKIFCESNAMVMMEDVMDLKGKATGGFGSSLLRRMAGGESFFQQHIEAVRGDGDCLLSPSMPGSITVLDVSPSQGYCLADGAFVAATSEVSLKANLQTPGRALFGGTGGFVIMECTGSGRVAVSGYGAAFTLDVTPQKDIIIDNSHVVAWDRTLMYELTVPSSGSQGFMGRLVSSATSGEGLVLRFRGTGKVVICSRNKDAFAQWVAGQMGRR